jgi:hypothetical protein
MRLLGHFWLEMLMDIAWKHLLAIYCSGEDHRLRIRAGAPPGRLQRRRRQT